jgi:hypothetical protein
MKHFIYKTSHISGLYYIGRHSTNVENDGYFGSGAWVTGIKDKSTLTREILTYANDIEELLLLEEKFIIEHINNDNNMNILLSSGGFKPGVENFTDVESVRQKMRGAKLGKSWEEIFGIKRAAELRAERSLPRGPMPDERKQNISDAKKGMVAPHNWSDESRQRVSNTMTGNITRTDEFKENQRKNVSVIVTCEHCGKSGSGIAMRRWHGINCKHNK